VGRKGGKSGSYDDWAMPDLLQRAKEIGIRGRSTMTKAELIKACGFLPAALGSYLPAFV
jgi:Rho termination factor-like protein